jgi:hypothetical protein
MCSLRSVSAPTSAGGLCFWAGVGWRAHCTSPRKVPPQPARHGLLVPTSASIIEPVLRNFSVSFQKMVSFLRTGLLFLYKYISILAGIP